MRRILFSLIFLVTVCSAFSQRVYFIYLQTESQQPFFVKMEEKLHSSTATGYLILSRLKDSVYSFMVGFPNNQVGEQRFICLINHKDHGFLIKNYGEKGWGLLDLQTNTVQLANNGGDNKGVSISNAPVNAFTELLAKAADDSTLKQKIVFTEEKKTETIAKAAEKKTDTSVNIAANKMTDQPKKTIDSVKKQEVAINNSSKQPATATNNKEKEIEKTASPEIQEQKIAEKNNESILPAGLTKAGSESAKLSEEKVKQDTQAAVTITKPESFAKTQVIRKSESSTTEGLGITYIDIQPDGKQDTIKILIPNNENKVQPAVAEEKANNISVKKNDESAAILPVNAVSKPGVKNNCKQIASDADFYKLRKRMAGENSDKEMLNEANKFFKVKCFTTRQIGNLGTLFLGDGGKYNFFEAAYLHVSDLVNFTGLQSELKDEYFINRFKTLVR